MNEKEPEKTNQTIVVCHNTSHYLWLHYSHVLTDLARHYKKVICISPRDGHEDEFEKAGLVYEPIVIEQHGMNPLRELKFVLDLYRIYKKHQPDVVFNFSIKPCLYGSLAGRLAGVETIASMVTGLGYVFLTKTLLAKGIRAMITVWYRIVLRQGDIFFFQNPDDASLFYESGISQGCRTETLPGTGVDTDYFNAPVSNPKVGHVRFLYIGRMLKDKGLLELHEATAMLKRRYPNFTMSFLGPMDENPSAISAQKIKEWQDQDTIEYLGQTTDVRPYIQRCDVFVLPSYREGLPRSGLEAMAMSRPVLTTDVPGCRELVIDEQNGFLVAAKNKDELARAMEVFILNPEVCTTMGAASRKRCCEFFDVASVSQKIVEQITRQGEIKSDS